MAEPHTLGYTVRWPFHGGSFNYKDYQQIGPQGLLRDIELMWIHVLREMLKIKPENFKVKSFHYFLCLFQKNFRSNNLPFFSFISKRTFLSFS